MGNTKKKRKSNGVITVPEAGQPEIRDKWVQIGALRAELGALLQQFEAARADFLGIEQRFDKRKEEILIQLRMMDNDYIKAVQAVGQNLGVPLKNYVFDPLDMSFKRMPK
jgi:hypothetical protein